MMNKLKKIFKYNKKPDAILSTKGPISIDGAPDEENCIHFKMWNAYGGKVIQTHRFDRIKDKVHRSMYIITDNQDIGQEIGKIITMEALR